MFANFVECFKHHVWGGKSHWRALKELGKNENFYFLRLEVAGQRRERRLIILFLFFILLEMFKNCTRFYASVVFRIQNCRTIYHFPN